MKNENNLPRYEVGDYVKTYVSMLNGDYGVWTEQYPMLISNLAMGHDIVEGPPLGEIYIVTAVFMSASDQPGVKFDYIYLIADIASHKMFLVKERVIAKVPVEEVMKSLEKLPKLNHNLATDIAFMPDRMHPFE